MDKIDVIYDLLKDLDVKQDSQTEKLVKLEVNVARNSDDLADHIKRTNLLEEKIELQKRAINQRFIKLEEPRTIIKSLSKALIWAGTVGVAIFGIYRGWLAIQHLF